MPLVREQAVHTYASTHGGLTYRFDVMLDSRGQVAVRNIQSSFGLVSDSYTSLPDVVVSDISEARGIMQQQLAEKVVHEGTIEFDGVASVEVAIPDDLLNNTDYRVVYTTPDGMVIRTTDPTIEAFTAEAAAVYGTEDEPIEVGFEVLVAAQQASVMSGTLTFVTADNGVVTVNFPSALTTTEYRVVLTPNGFFPVRVLSKTKAKMVVQLGYTLGTGQSVTVGYDVFV